VNVGILGSGDVGQALGRGFLTLEHRVMLGSREAENPKGIAWAKQSGARATHGSFTQAARFGEIVVLATLGLATENAIRLAGPEHFRGKLVLDATNPLDFSKGMPPGLFMGISESLGERIQRKLPDARVVKCFNTVNSSQMVNPTYKDIEMLICGNDATAKKEVARILKEFGWKGVIDVGGIEGARWLEALVPLWVRVGSALNTWTHVFKVMHE
jgi:predicted dinucleotide-binding enzyme